MKENFENQFPQLNGFQLPQRNGSQKPQFNQPIQHSDQIEYIEDEYEYSYSYDEDFFVADSVAEAVADAPVADTPVADEDDI